ncbi:hypothetical protein SLA2020_528960 [Shorea laevis]
MEEITAASAEHPATIDHRVIQIPDYDSMVFSIKERMEDMTTARCIRRVNENLRQGIGGNSKVYVPGKISIGPLHHGEEKLESMENHKWRYVYSLLNRKPHLELTLDSCVKVLRESEHKARLFYAEEIRLSSDEFVQLLLIDGCFLIELILRYAVRGLKRRGDLVFNTHGLLFELRSDMVLLENQIPFFILQQLFQIVPIPTQCNQSLTELAFQFFKDMIPGDHRVHLRRFSHEGNHLLDLLHHCFLPTYPRVKVKQDPAPRGFKVPATELASSGITLKKAATDQDLLDVKFSKGVLVIPPLHFHQYTESLLRNFIAMEHSSSETTKHVTSYVILMKSLLKSKKDVKFLYRKQILSNYDNDYEYKDVLNMFQSMWKEEELKDFHYDGLCEEVNAYQGGRCKRIMKTGFLKNRVSRTVFIVVVLLIVLSLVGILLSVLSFSRHRP